MALIQYFADDLDGTQGDDVETRVIKLPDGVLRIDLSEANYAKLTAAIAKAVKAVIKAENYTKFYVETPNGSDSTVNALIRKWARDTGRDVSAKGRIAEDIVAAYHKSLADAASKSDAGAATDGDANDNADKASEAVSALVSA